MVLLIFLGFDEHRFGHRDAVLVAAHFVADVMKEDFPLLSQPYRLPRRLSLFSPASLETNQNCAGTVLTRLAGIRIARVGEPEARGETNLVTKRYGFVVQMRRSIVR